MRSIQRCVLVADGIGGDCEVRRRCINGAAIIGGTPDIPEVRAHHALGNGRHPYSSAARIRERSISLASSQFRREMYGNKRYSDALVGICIEFPGIYTCAGGQGQPGDGNIVATHDQDGTPNVRSRPCAQRASVA
jgi:hypothetical protein